MDNKKNEQLIPWGDKIMMPFRVPRIVALGKKPLTKKLTAGAFLQASNFRKQLQELARQHADNLKQRLPGLELPLEGCPVRLDSLWLFSADDEGRERMMAYHESDLKRALYGGLVDILIADDRLIVEGYFAKGEGLPGAEGEIVVALLSRAGFRSVKEMEPLFGLPIFPPWRPEDQGGIIRPDSQAGKRIITELHGRH